MKSKTKKISLIIIAIILTICVIFSVKDNFIVEPKIANAMERPVINADEETAQEEAIENPNQRIEDTKASNLLKISENDIVLGSKDAPVTMVEYASLSCPHCAAFYKEGFAKFKKDYLDTGKVKLVYRDFPLNKPAFDASLLALCQVKDKNNDAQKYHDFIKALFLTQDSWAFTEEFSSKLQTIAKLEGMSKEEFEACVNNKELQTQILAHRLEASQNLKISSTPTFFINGEMISGYGKYGDIENAIEKKLSAIKK